MKKYSVAYMLFLIGVGAMASQVFAAPVEGRCEIARNLALGVSGEDVRCLQRYLNAKGFIISASGPGSVGNESIYFGTKTRAAVARWQQARGISPAAGYFGKISRAAHAVDHVVGEVPTITPTPPPPSAVVPSPPPSPVVAQSYTISILAPVLGASARVGDQLVIAWEGASAIPTGHQAGEIGFELLDGSNRKKIADINLNEKRYAWTVEGLSSSIDRYRFYIIQKKTQSVGDAKSDFVTLAYTNAFDPTLADTRLEVTQPVRGASLAVGSTYSVEWQGGAFAWPLDIQVSNVSSANIISLAKSVPNTGSHMWQVANDVPEGQYVARVVCTLCPLATPDTIAEGKIFTVTK